MGYLKTPLLACGVLLLAGCATQQPYLATHTNSSELAQIHELHVVSVIDQDKLKAQDNLTLINPGYVAAAGLEGGLIGALVMGAEVEHKAHVFAAKHMAPLLPQLVGYDGRAAVRQTLQQGLATLPVHMADWRTVDKPAKDADLLPATAPAGSAWLILRSEYSMTPNFAGVQVITHATLYIDMANATWRSKPAYKNELTYQSPLLRMPDKSDAVRKQMTDQENARYAKLDIGAQITKANAGSPYDKQNAELRQQIQDEQLQHRNTLKQIASPSWSADDCAALFVQQWQKDGASALRQFVSEGGQQTVRMLALDLNQPQPVLDKSVRRTWITVSDNDGRAIQDAPDGKVYSLADVDVTYGPSSYGAPVATAPAAH